MPQSFNVVVHPPDSRGLRAVTVDRKGAGCAWSPRELRRLLRRAGLPKDLPLNDPSICWRGADRTTWPDHPWRRRATAGLMVVGLLGSMVLLMFIGLEDALDSMTFAGRLTGFLFIFAAAVEGVASLAALDFENKRQWQFSGAGALVGVLISLAANSLLLAMWLQNFEYILLLPVFIALWVWSIWGLFVLYRNQAWKDIPHPKRFALGLLLTGALAGTNFSYSTLYQPTAQRPLIATETKFGTARTEGGSIHLPLEVRVRNLGKLPVWVLGTIYWVNGESRNFSEVQRDLAERKSDPEKETGTNLYTTPAAPRLISTGWWVTPGSWLDPGAQYSTVKIIRIPSSATYDSIRASAQAYVIRRDLVADIDSKFRDGTVTWGNSEGKDEGCPLHCDTYITYQARVAHNKNFINVTRKPRYVVSWMTIHKDGNSSELKAGIGPLTRDKRVSSNKRDTDQYGIHYLQSGDAEVPFVALKEPPPPPGGVL